MKLLICVVTLLGITRAIVSHADESVTLQFNSTANVIHDRNELPTGFTTRLPGTGGAIPKADPNIDLLASPGKLLLTSTHADLNQSPGPTGNNLENLEAPGIRLSNVGSSDVNFKAVFENVNVPNGSDHLVVYAGVNENLVICAGIHELNVFTMFKNLGAGNIGTASPPKSFSSGDSIEVGLSRRAGLWILSWNNLTTKTSGSLPGVSFPELDKHSDLYVGVQACNAGTVPGQSTIKSFVAKLDSFSATVARTVQDQKSAKLRSWTIAPTNQTLRAEYIGTKIVLRLSGGRTRTVNINTLSDSDRRFVIEKLLDEDDANQSDSATKKE